MQMQLWQKSKRLTRSLSLRIFFICSVLLIFPLFFHTFFIYYHEYEQKKIELFTYLNELATSYAFRIEDILKFQSSLTNLIIEKGDFQSSFFEKILNDGTLSAIYFFKKGEKGQFLLNSFALKSLEEKFTDFPFDKLEKEKNLVFFDKDSKRCFRGKLIDDGELFTAANIDFKVKADLPINLTLLSSSKKIKGNLTIKVPLKDLDLNLFLSVPEEDLKGFHRRDYVKKMALFFLFVLAGSLAVGYLVFKMAFPLKKLYHTMDKVKGGDLNARFSEDKWGFELNHLGNFFNETLDAIIRLQKEEKMQKLEKQQLLKEFQIGHKIQRKLLPPKDFTIPGLDIASGFLPAKEVGGDFYDLFSRKNGEEVAFVVADVTGKGISACLYSLGVRSSFRSFAYSEEGLDKIVKHVNDLFCLDAKNDVFVTAWFGLYDTVTKKLTFNSSGHPPALLNRRGKLINLSTDGMALGVDKDMKIEQKEIFLESEDVLLIYTDGVTDSINENNELFGTQRVRDFFEKNYITSSQKIALSLFSSLRGFSKSVIPADDIAFLVIKAQTI